MCGETSDEDSNQNAAASSSQVWQSDVKPNVSAVRPAVTETNQNCDLSARAVKIAKLKVQTSSTSTQSGETISRYLLLMSHLLRKSTQTCDRKLIANQGDDMNDLDTNSLIWGMFMLAALGCSSSSWQRLFG